ncbi:MAG: transporter [Bacteroidota bacterium]
MLFLPSIVYSQEFTKAIEDNSFFIEEAYNQEEGVIQHIFNGTIISPENEWESSFTEEWPLLSQLHQLSVTIPYHFSTLTNTPSNSIGDVQINYRYEVLNEKGLAIAPRGTIILPTGNPSKHSGYGKTGFQFNLPVSKRFSNEFVMHYNAGWTYIPNVRWKSGSAAFSEYIFGASAIYLANPHFNLLTEILFRSSGTTFDRSNELIISPGVRWAIDIGDLQIVPGFAYSVYFIEGSEIRGFFFYLSFEHSY